MVAMRRSMTAWTGSISVSIGIVVAAAWGLMLALMMSGRADLIAHDTLLADRTLPRLTDLILFIATWQVMTAAMMLPSSEPMARLFARASQRQERPRLALSAFLLAYFVVWTAFAIVALMGDAVLHLIVERWIWLDQRPQLITGVVLILAGGFQFSDLKERCLDACRNPVSFLWRYYGRGIRRASTLGVRHGLFCLGCCWALMLVMFAVGVGSIVWMALLAGVMVVEKAAPWGRKLAPVVGVALIALGVAVIAGA
jgi:predicted metal-binding membrane protein